MCLESQLMLQVMYFPSLGLQAVETEYTENISTNLPKCHRELKNTVLEQFHFAWITGSEQIVSLLLICLWPKQ